MWHVRGTRQVHAGFSWGDLRKRDHLEDLRLDNFKLDNQEVGMGGGMDWIDLA
jgi:hypothetical protein